MPRDGAIIFGDLAQKKAEAAPGRNDAEERRPARAVPKRDLPLINIES
jgi:hypothetical protein